jgi:hypothetical protein
LRIYGVGRGTKKASGGVTRRPESSVCPHEITFEAKESLMDWIRRNWWIALAVVIAPLEIAFGIGNLVEDDGGPLYGRVVAAVIFVAAGLLTLTGVALRARYPVAGSRMIAAGMLPMGAAVSIVWFPPAMVVGVLAIAIAVIAFRDSTRPVAEPADAS